MGILSSRTRHPLATLTIVASNTALPSSVSESPASNTHRRFRWHNSSSYI